MKVAIVGKFADGHLGASLERAFLRRGHGVLAVEPGPPTFLEGSRWTRGVRARLLKRVPLPLRAAISGDFSARMLTAVLEGCVDVAVLLNGEFVLPSHIRILKAHGVRVCIFYCDNPLPGVFNYESRPEMIPSAREADLVCAWSGALVRELHELGVKHAAFVPFAWDDALHPFGEASDPEFEVAFVGGWDREREGLLGEIAREFDLRIWGPSYWETRASNRLVRAAWQGEAARGDAFARVVRRAGVVLNPLRLQHSIAGERIGVIMRHFEVPGAGGLVCSTWSRDAANIFPGAGRTFFHDLRECASAVKYFRSDVLRRAYISQMHETVARHHTYAHRVDAILERLN